MDDAYTYRNGEKIALTKSENEFVVRALPEALSDAGVENAVQISSASSRVAVTRMEIEPMMERARAVAPTYHSCLSP